MLNARPIFIHSLFRSASTYFFDKVRRLGPAFTCYQEPFHEALLVLNEPARHARLLEPPVGGGLRHPPLEQPYFYEFWQRRQSLRGLFREPFSYRHYFSGSAGELPDAQARYLRALIELADGRPVLQLCRSAGRIAELRGAFGGLHIHLWREPRAQWWSYKVNDYFERASRSIYFSRHLPASLREIRSQLRLSDSKACVLDSRGSYVLFYALWLDAWLRLTALSDLSISIDAAAATRDGNDHTATVLAQQLGRQIDLSDLRASGMQFSADEEPFYEQAEAGVQRLFVQSRAAGPVEIEQAALAARQARRLHEQFAHDRAAECSLRQGYLRLMDRWAGSHRAGPLSRVLAWRPKRLRHAWHAWKRRSISALGQRLGGPGSPSSASSAIMGGSGRVSVDSSTGG